MREKRNSVFYVIGRNRLTRDRDAGGSPSLQPHVLHAACSRSIEASTAGSAKLIQSPTMSEEEQAPVDQPSAEENIEDTKEWGDDITEDKNGGLYKKILTLGQGSERPMSGDEVSVHYTGRLLNGDVFDSSVERGEVFKFKLGEGQVIKGWDQGVATMNRGEKCILTCKPDYAYGENGSPPKIPPNSTLRFEVELFDWSGEDITGMCISPLPPGGGGSL